MSKEKTLCDRLYTEPAYYELARAVGYRGCTYRQLTEMIDDLGKRHGKAAVERAAWHLVTYEGQNTTAVKSLAKVELQPEARRLCWQLLGPSPEQWDAWASAFATPPPNPYAQEPSRARPPSSPR